MTHPSLQPLTVLLEQAQRDRDQALQRQRKVEAALAAAEVQAEQLRDYRAECEGRWGQQFRKGVTMTLMQVYQDFVGRLHGAVDSQGEQIDRLRADLARCIADSVAAELRVASVRKLIERREVAALRSMAQREQKQFDEMASRAAWRRMTSHGALTGHGAMTVS
ncbi:MAG: flagellar export protein FliJ [Burkholderiales bacterium]